MERPQRRLDRERHEETEEQPLLRGRAQRHVHQLAEQERARVPGVYRVHVERDDGDQHQQAAEQAVEQELDRRVLPLADAVAPDHEVHRDQHGLEEHVEQEHVCGGEDPDHHGLEHEHQREIRFNAPPRGRLARRIRLAFRVVPRGQHDYRHQDHGHQQQDQRDPVDADRVVDAELRDPLVGLVELERGPAGVELRGHRDRHRERGQREDQRDLLHQPVAGAAVGLPARRGPAWRQRDHDGPGERDGAADRQPGKGAHL
jgi:hypothetical protein